MQKVERHANRKTILTAILWIAILVLLLISVLQPADQMVEKENATVLQNAIANAVVSCYAIEGRYPDSLEKIKKDYGVVIDDDKYIVSYDIFADNLMPDVTVDVKGEN